MLISRADVDNNRLLVNVAVSGEASGLTVTTAALDGTNQVVSATGAPREIIFIWIFPRQNFGHRPIRFSTISRFR